jgi:hypothetical protein
MRRILVIVAIVLVACSPLALPLSALAQSGMQGRAEDAATELSRLESSGSWSDLYALMHPDAQAIIPIKAVTGWYANEYGPQGPGLITVTGSQKVSWTWKVNGKTYPTTEVYFTQPFADGRVVEDVVRLVWTGNRWGWFFGRNADFVQDQIAKYASNTAVVNPAPQASTSGGDHVRGLTSGGRKATRGMPSRRRFSPPSARNGTVVREESEVTAIILQRSTASIRINLPPPRLAQGWTFRPICSTFLHPWSRRS